MAPDVGFEPTTKRLTAAYSTAELIWNFAQKIKRNFSVFFVKSQVKWCRYSLRAKKRAKKIGFVLINENRFNINKPKHN